MSSQLTQDLGRLVLGGYPPRAPTDPYVDALETIRFLKQSLRFAATEVAESPVSYSAGLAVTRYWSSKPPACCPPTLCLLDAALPIPRGPWGASAAASPVLSRHCDFLPFLPPHFVMHSGTSQDRLRNAQDGSGQLRNRSGIGVSNTQCRGFLLVATCQNGRKVATSQRGFWRSGCD